MKHTELNTELKKLNAQIELIQKDTFKVDQKISALEEKKIATGARIVKLISDETKYSAEIEKAKSINVEISILVNDRSKLVSKVTKLRNRISEVTAEHAQQEAFSAIFQDDFFTPDQLKALCIILRENGIQTAQELASRITSKGSL